VANHAPIFLFRIIGLFTLITIFKIDTQAEKITHYLDSQDYHYSHKAIEEFCNTFGSNYKILQVILETATESDFDSTYYRFMRFNKIREQACDPVN